MTDIPVAKIAERADSTGPDRLEQARIFAARRRVRYRYNAEDLSPSEYSYVGWIDLMGAGHIMSVSVQKTANFIVHLQMAIDIAAAYHSDVDLLPINDGVFIITNSQQTIQQLMRDCMVDLACYFISTPRPHDRFLVRGSISYGPVYSWKDLRSGLSRKKRALHEGTLKHVFFGPPIIQPYQSESTAAPYGIAVHESARSFSPPGTLPFRMNHWLWWSTQKGLPQHKGVAPLASIKDVLLEELNAYFLFQKNTAIFQVLKEDKIREWETKSSQYFSIG